MQACVGRVGVRSDLCTLRTLHHHPILSHPLNPLNSPPPRRPPFQPFQKYGQMPIDLASKQEIKDLLVVPLAATQAGLLRAACDGDLARVRLAVETHKLDPNTCRDVSAGATICFVLDSMS